MTGPEPALGLAQPEPKATKRFVSRLLISAHGGVFDVKPLKLRGVAGIPAKLESMDFAQAIKELQDTAIVMAEIQRRQAEVQKTQAEELELSRKRMAQVETNLVEITDKLNGLIGYLDGQYRPPA